MSKINILILRTAGTNCERETVIAFEILKARVKLTHINELLDNSKKILSFQIIVIPGGFTYGDDIAAGKILANELKMRMQEHLNKFLSKNGLIIGICNGFQVLVKMGLLPGNPRWQQQVSLGANNSGKFEARWTYLRTVSKKCVWFKNNGEIIYLPVAHGEGKFIPKDEWVLKELIAKDQIMLQYCDVKGNLSAYPDNPNGSVNHVAGICDETGKILGLMPHPERYILTTQHPRWTREKQKGEPQGLAIFKNGMEFLKTA